ncbi:hypothetical protein NLI96_g11943 [Meripilus lineatus]|uniref:Yeast cell wall synthesis Kre9/Knh1-like N-terminal domain-containing protein n=1 Tax=Meripilus lineatus TaxID=2056292 RepID=A0AAD5US96_9APHY|nr:hypothetical protein NLI96_g11943 [Physisporinus lineatus]
MRFASFAALALLPASALAAISITGPSESAYWVQNASNVITWNFAAGDSNPISIIVTNANNTFLNGAFSIAEFVDLSQKSFTGMTNVTLKVADGYNVAFVNPLNQSEVLATGPSFSVKPSGTALAPTASGSIASATSGAASPSGSASGSSNSSAAPSATGASNNNNGAVGIGAQGLMSVIAACGLATLSAVLL